VLVGIVALAVGLGVGRFVTYDAHTPAVVTERPVPASATGAAAGQDLATTVAALEAQTQRDPTNPTTWDTLASDYVRRAGQTGDPSFYDLAQKAYGRADALAPGLPDTLIGEGLLALSRHQFANALVIAQRVLRVQPQDPDALVVKTDGDVELGHYAAAATDLSTLLAHHPVLAVYARVSYLRELHGDIPGAVAAMQQARIDGASDPLDAADVTDFLGDLNFNSGHAAAALGEYNAALALSPLHVLASVGRARALAALGHTNQAINELNALVNRYPLPQAAELLGDLDTAQGRMADASDAYGLVRVTTRLQQASGVVVDLELARFEADHANGAVGKRYALGLANAAYRERPTNLYAADVLEWARFRAGDIAGARALMGRALRLGTRDAILHYHAAAVLHASGDDATARGQLVFAFHENPWFTWFLRGEATALARALGVPPPAAWAR
jgi:predicted Zn-dependent protease